MGGEIVNPGDLHGRVLPADEIALTWDGNLISAIVGPNLVEGVSGFGEAVHDALRELADNLIAEAVWIEVNRNKIDLAQVRPVDSGTLQTNIVELYRIDDARVCAVAGPEDSSVGIFGIGGGKGCGAVWPFQGIAPLVLAVGLWWRECRALLRGCCVARRDRTLGRRSYFDGNSERYQKQRMNFFTNTQLAHYPRLKSRI
jgi:hypothetical protein